MVCGSYMVFVLGLYGYCVNFLVRLVEFLLDLYVRGFGIEIEVEVIFGFVVVEDNFFFEGGYCGRIMYIVYIVFFLVLVCGLIFYFYL